MIAGSDIIPIFTAQEHTDADKENEAPLTLNKENVAPVSNEKLIPQEDDVIFKEPISMPVPESDSADNMFTNIKSLPTPPSSDTESLSGRSADVLPEVSRFKMECKCGTKKCRKFLFF